MIINFLNYWFTFLPSWQLCQSTVIGNEWCWHSETNKCWDSGHGLTAIGNPATKTRAYFPKLTRCVAAYEHIMWKVLTSWAHRYSKFEHLVSDRFSNPGPEKNLNFTSSHLCNILTPLHTTALNFLTELYSNTTDRIISIIFIRITTNLFLVQA